MPNTKSAIKQIKTDVGRSLRNKSRKSSIRTFEKKFLMKIEEKDLESAKSFLSQTFCQYDKAAKSNTVHPNHANRKKSRLMAIYSKAGGR